jgi:Flp pilus assembly protein TadG
MTAEPGRRARPDLDGERGGFAALELAICLPFVIVILLLVAAFGRVERGRELLDQAAASAARAASLATSSSTAQRAATTAATESLTDGGLSCTGIQVRLDVTAFHPGGQVTTHVSCTTDLAGLTLSGVPGHLHLTASATSPLEPYRQLTSGATR